MKAVLLTVMVAVCLSPGSAVWGAEPPGGCVLIPAGSFEMGDHHGFVDPKHGGDETPLHTVKLDAFYMGVGCVTNAQYCEFLNAALALKVLAVRADGGVYLVGGQDLLCETRSLSQYSRLGYAAGQFSVLDGKEQHPVVCLRWPGAAVYCNWLSFKQQLPQCYNPRTWECDFGKSGYRLPTEAEWEYAGRGGLQQPYRNYPWGDEPDVTKANWPESRNPFRSGPQPWTTPVGFFDGQLKRKADYQWPGPEETFQPGNGVNGYGLYDMAGNVWQFVNDWYVRDYYAYSPAANPVGPERGSLMPDGLPYRGMRGGNWYNGEHGHSRVSNRNPSYWRGPLDPNHPYYHVSFRIVRPVDAESRPLVKPTPVQDDGRPGNGGGGQPGGRPPREGGPGGNAPRLERAPRTGDFVLRSPVVADGGALPAEFSGDGAGVSPPLEWRGAPAGTQAYAVIMHHLDPQGAVKWYWVLYDLPATVQSLPKGVHGVGTCGSNSINDRTEYAPPRSRGPGAKHYLLTVYALSAQPQLAMPASRVDRAALLAAIKDRTLAAADLEVVYTRPGETPGGDRLPPTEAGVGGAVPPAPGGGGREPHAENRTPTSPNPGQTVGLFLNQPAACPGYTLFAPKHNNVIYLLDNNGRIAHQWQSQYEPGQSVYLKPDGHLLHCCFTKNRGFTSGGEGGRVEEFDWDGKLVWQFDCSSDQYLSHHDIAPLPNGNLLLLMVEKKSLVQCVAAGFSADQLRDGQLFPDSVIEVQPIYPRGAKLVWQWRVWDHLIQSTDRNQANFGDPSAHPELIDVNCNGRATPAFWNHANSIAYNAKLDQVMISARGCNELWIVDHSTTTQEAASHRGGRHGKGGDLLYRWGNPAAYGRGTLRDKQLVQQHDAEWIPDGYPGAGHITIFNNGYDRGWSSIEEIVPPTDADGRYVLEPGRAYGPDKPVWHYEAINRTDFFSSEISGAHRLPNGNTLVCAGVVGHLFEVTPGGQTVWQYVNPMVRGGILAQGEQPGKDVRGHLFNAVFKAHRYPPDYPGLVGRDLTPRGVIELPATQTGQTGLDRADAPPEERGGGGRRPRQ